MLEGEEDPGHHQQRMQLTSNISEVFLGFKCYQVLSSKNIIIVVCSLLHGLLYYCIRGYLAGASS